VRQVLTRVALVSLLPMAVFYSTLSLFGLRAAALVTATLYYAGLFTRVIRRKPVLAAAVFAAGLLGLRTVVVFCTGSAFLYFLQPIAGTVAVATAFAASTVAGRPIIERLAHDFCPLTPELSSQLRSARFFSWVSLVWTISYGVNAVGTMWLLTSASIDALVIIKAIAGPMLTLAAATATYLVFRRVMRLRNVSIRFANHEGWSRAAT
jgi:hypothetical protein